MTTGMIRKLTGLVCIMLLYISVPPMTGNAQQLQRHEAIAAYIYNFAKNVQWQNEDAIQEFHFLIFGQDEKITKEMLTLSKTKTLRNKPIKVSSSESLEDCAKAQLIFVTKGKEQQYVSLFDRIEGKNILLVSDGYLDKRLIMINFIQSEKGTLRFEINKANIINQHLLIMQDMILLGGTEIDVAALYREGQQSLREVQKQSEESQKHMKEIEGNISRLESIVASKTKEIQVQKDSLDRQTLKIQEQQRILDAQSREFTEREKDRAAQIQKASEQQMVYEAKSQELKKQQNDLQKGETLLREQQDKINGQQAKILSQTKILEKQGETIHRQKSILYLLMTIIVLVVMLVLTVYNGYNSKQKLNRELEQKVAERTDELRTSNEQLNNELAERQRAEASVSIAHQRLMNIIEFLPDATFVIDQNKKVIAWNRACEIMTGLQKDAVLGLGDYAYAEPFFGERRPVLIDMLDHSSPEEEAKYKYVKRTDDILFAEFFIPHMRDGRGAHLWGIAAPLFDRDGQRSGAIEVIRDVTEQKLVEYALHESERKYRTLFETSGDAILLMRDDRFIDCNAQTLSVFGCNRERIIGASLHEFSPPTQQDGQRSREKILEKINLAAAEGSQFFEWEHCRFDGTPFWAEVNLTRLELGGETLLQAVVCDITERKRAEEALRQSEEQFRLIMENLSDLVAVLDLEGKRLYNSPSYQGILGNPVNLLGSSSFNEIHPEDRERVKKVFQETVRTGVGHRMEYRLVNQDGQARYIESQGSVIRDIRDRVSQVVVVSRDVTERKQAEEQLEVSERKYRELVEHANSIILRWTHDGRITFLNEFGQRFFGYTAEEIIGRHVMETIVPEIDSNNSRLRSLLDQISADPVAFEQNVNENIRRNGERVWIAWTNKIVHDAQGQVSEILSVGTDITERKEAEEALRQSESTLRSLFLAAPVGICILKNRIQMIANKHWCEMLGYPEADIIGKTTRMLYESDEEYNRVGKDLYSNLQKKGMTLIESRMRCSDGSVRDVILTAAPIRQDDLTAGVVGIIHDITERKQAEEQIHRLHAELQHHAAELEQRVAERTAELAVARDRAEAADRLKSAFLATMSHELRTPLNSIIGFTGIILQGLAGPLNPEQHKQLEMVRDSARHLLALINDVLDISKIEAGQLEVSSEPFDLRASIGKVAGIVKPLAEKKSLALQVELAPEIGALVSDPRRVEQVLLNLLNNAIKFTERGAVTLTAEILPDEPGALHSVIKISIADTGIGIKTEDLSKLFQPFRQIDTGLSRQHEGTGLGLAICRRLAELLGGEINAMSDWGKGSVFTFTLPMKGQG